MNKLRNLEERFVREILGKNDYFLYYESKITIQENIKNILKHKHDQDLFFREKNYLELEQVIITSLALLHSQWHDNIEVKSLKRICYKF